MPFSFEETKEDKLINCLQAFQFYTPLTISLKNYGCFEPRVIFINVAEHETLFVLQKKLVRHVKQHLQIFNQSDDMRGFHPHVTIAFRDLKKANFYKVWEDYKSKVFFESFPCHSIALLKHEKDQWNIYKEFNFTLK